jgi:hypothetical protein
MATAIFYGASDDLIEVEGVKGADEFTALDSPKGPVGSFVLGEQIRVRAYYDRHGLWSFAVSQVADGVSLPNWPIRISQQPDCDYSTRLEIDCPANTVLVVEKI